MTKKTRNILFLFFVLLFFIITPLASLYTAGYKINFSWPPNIDTALQKTGMFIIDTEPEGAEVLIDGKNPKSFIQKILNQKESKVTTPAKIKNLLPGEYKVQIKLEGHWNWEKKLKIQSGQTTIVDNLRLFKKTLPLEIANIKFQNEKISPKQKYLAYTQDNEIQILNLNTNETKNTGLKIEKETNNNKIIWAPDENKVIVGTKILNLTKNKIIDIESISKNQISNLKWGENSSKIFFQEDKKINYFDIYTEKITQIIEGDMYVDYQIKNNEIIATCSLNNCTKIKIYSISDKKLIKEMDIPGASQYLILDKDNELTHLYNEKFEILYLINLESNINPLEEVINNVKYIKWMNKNRVLCANDFEIWTQDISNGEKTLITRISENIENIFLGKDNKYVIYSTEKGIKILELEETNKRNLTEIINAEKIYFSDIDEKNEVIYFGARIGNREGIYKIEI